LIETDVILDVFRDERAVSGRHGAEVAGGEDGVGGQIGELAGLDDVADLVAGDVGLEEGLDGGDRRGLIGLAVGDELGEFLLQQLVFGLKAGNQAEDLLQNLAQAQAAVRAIVTGRPQTYERDWWRVSAVPLGLAAALVTVTSAPAVRSRIVPAADALPSVFGSIVGLVAGRDDVVSLRPPGG